MSKPPLKVSVIVVSFNTQAKLRQCLAAIEPEHEVIVVDNASVDGSTEVVEAELPTVRLIRNPTNVGFGTANNQGTRVASGDLWLYLNSDAYADPGAIAKLAECFENPEIVAAGGRLLNPNRSPQQSIAGPLSLRAVFLEQTLLERLFAARGKGYWRTTQVHANWESTLNPVPVDQIMGACLMVRPGVAEFDSRYFLYCEDTDLCLRLSQHGKLVYRGDATFIHDLGSSSSKNPWLGIARYNLGKETYFRIHHGPIAAFVCWTLNRLGALIRLILKPKERATFWRVLTARRSQLVPGIKPQPR